MKAQFYDPIARQTAAAKEKMAARRDIGVKELEVRSTAAILKPAPKKVAAAPAVAAMFEEDSGGKKDGAAAKVVLKRVSEMVALARDAEKRLAEAEQRVKDEKAKVFKLSTIEIPELLEEAGLKVVVLEDGTKVEVRDEYNCAITAVNQA